MKLTKIIVIFISAALLFNAGCTLLDIGGVLGTPTHGEKVVPAEFDLKNHVDKENTILVLVDGGPVAAANITFQQNLSDIISGYLQARAKIDGRYVASNALPLILRTLSMSRSSGITPEQVARQVGAKWVLHVIIEDYNLYQMHDSSYYSGSLATRSFLYDAESGQRIWPAEPEGKYIFNRVELEVKGKEATTERLRSAAGYCITRYLYDCKEDQFRVADEVEYHGMSQFE